MPATMAKPSKPKRMGRPPMADPRKHLICFRVTQAELAALKAEHASVGPYSVALSEVARAMMVERLQEKGRL